ASCVALVSEPPPACAPATCAALGASCGQVPDGCGGVLWCGECAEPETCGGGGAANACGLGTCAPASCEGRCGIISDGCAATLDCGGCDGGCSTATSCAAQGKNCGE